MGTVAPTVKAEFSLTDDQLGLLFTAFALAYAMFEVPSGWLGDVRPTQDPHPYCPVVVRLYLPYRLHLEVHTR